MKDRARAGRRSHPIRGVGCRMSELDVECEDMMYVALGRALAGDPLADRSFAALREIARQEIIAKYGIPSFRVVR